ncbi:MAG: hypothetical protein Q8M22_18445 [Actinomycetota bacterium]|nr:hypothetical protein [Actinomycetota bacterium]
MSPSQIVPGIYRPRPWYLAAVAAIGACTLAVVNLLFWRDLPVAFLLIIPAGGVIGSWTALTIEVSPDGIMMARRRIPWASLRVHQSRFGESLRTVKGRSPRAKIFLPIYARNWRQSRLGDDIRRWAPHLLPAEP